MAEERPRLISKRSLITLSHALEEAALAQECAGEDPVLAIALFQRAAYFDSEAARYGTLAPGHRVLVAFSGEARRFPEGVECCPLDPQEPLAREWSLVFVGRSAGAGLVATDRRSLVLDGRTLERRRAFSSRISFQRSQALAEARRILDALGDRVSPEFRRAFEGVAGSDAAIESHAEARLARIATAVVEGLERAEAQSRRYEEQMRQQFDAAHRDPLTGLYNRRYLDHFLGRSRDRGDQLPELAVLFCDVDHFKRVNDSLGHDAGDEVLRAVSRAIAGSLRDGDLAIRWGGDEFLALLPGCPIEPARQVADRIRRSVAESQLSGGLPDLQVSLSIGAAVSAEGGDLLQAADAALYRAKSAGRNRVEV